jgi:hypothetical protein
LYQNISIINISKSKFKTMFTYNFHLTMFLHYNERLVKKEWRSRKEEKFIRGKEKLHADAAAALMPDSEFVNVPQLTAAK